MLEYLKIFSNDYANGITSLSAFGALILSIVTLIYLKKDFFLKYKPYVLPLVHIEKFRNSLDCFLTIVPKNVGASPCEFKLTDIKLIIGDEEYDTPSSKEWSLLGPGGGHIGMPAGRINEIGITRIRNNNYRSNRIELQFILQTKSTHGHFKQSEEFTYEINVLSDEPQVLFRSEWKKDIR